MGGRTGANGPHVREHFIFPWMKMAALQSQLGKTMQEGTAHVYVDLVLNKNSSKSSEQHIVQLQTHCRYEQILYSFITNRKLQEIVVVLLTMIPRNNSHVVSWFLVNGSYVVCLDCKFLPSVRFLREHKDLTVDGDMRGKADKRWFIDLKLTLCVLEENLCNLYTVFCLTSTAIVSSLVPVNFHNHERKLIVVKGLKTRICKNSWTAPSNSPKTYVISSNNSSR